MQPQYPFCNFLLGVILTGSGLCGTADVAIGQDEPLKRKPQSKPQKAVVFEAKDKIKVNAHTFELKPGKLYYVFARAKEFYPLFRVETKKGELVGLSRSYSQLGQKPQQTFLVVEGSNIGPYQVVITAPFGGALTSRDLSYSILVQEAPNPIFHFKGQLTKTDDTYRFRKGAFYKVHKLKLKKGTTYNIAMESEKMDGVVFLEDPNGRFIRRSLGKTKRSQIVYRVRVDGTYRVVATTSLPNQVGHYQIVVRSILLTSKK
ncbi:MAG: hypothetical protein ACFCD0_15565 [Gemmataceae bacterium]